MRVRDFKFIQEINLKRKVEENVSKRLLNGWESLPAARSRVNIDSTMSGAWQGKTPQESWQRTDNDVILSSQNILWKTL